MKIFSNFKINFFKIFLLISLSFSFINAAELINEQFTSNIDEWSVDDSDKVFWTSDEGGSMFIDANNKAWRTYSFGASYANQSLSVEIEWCATNSWESWEDYLRVKINDTTEEEDYDGGGCQTTTFSANTNPIGDFKIEFSPQVDNSNEDAYIKWFTIEGISLATPPVINSSSFTIPKVSPTGTTVGTVIASPQATTFEMLSGDTDNIFSINNSGIITVSSSTNLTNTSATSYILSIKATNTFGSDTENITINITTAPIVTTNQREFSIRNPISTRNIKGNIKVIGNTVLCWKDGGTSCKETTATNNNLNLSFVDTDSNSYTYNNSSQAQIAAIPDSATVVWAGFYTQGYLKENATNTQSLLTATPAILTTPSGTNISLTPTVIDVFEYDNNDFTYATFNQVTDLVGLTGTQVNGWYTGANIKAKEGSDSNPGNFGAWTLVVIYEDDSETLKNISVFDGYKRVSSQSEYNNVDIPITGFLTPTNGDISSTLSIFAGEGDIGYEGDKLYLDGTAINDTNAFNSSTNGFVANPDLANNSGIDIQNHNVGSTGLNPLDIITNSQQSALINMTSSLDAYFPSMVAFSTELYEPRVCYKQEFFDENGDAIDSVAIGDTITVSTWISNMKKDSSDINLEIADKVEITVELDNENLEYIAGSTNMRNVYESDFSSKTDAPADDLADFFFDTNTTKWRVGTGASSTDGGELTPNFTASNDNKAFITFQTKLLKEGDISINNIYKVSYENSQLGIRFGDESPLNIGVCADINSSLGVAGALGKFNVVNETGGSGFFNDPSSSQTWLTTQVVNKPFTVKVISLNDTGTALQNYSGDVTLSLISNPYDGSCGNDDLCKQLKCETATPITIENSVTLDGLFLTKTLTYNTAAKNVFFKIAYDLGTKFACSVDSFAIRPDKFNLTFPVGEDTELLTAAQNYNLSLIAAEYSTGTASMGYDVANAQTVLNLEKVLYNPDGTDGSATLNGTLAFSPTLFNILNGSASNVGLSFNDVGKVNIKMIDKTWAAIDIDNGDTTEDCSSTGAYICGDINATFIPSHFALSNVTLHNSNNSNFTYLSTDLNISAPFDITVTAQNTLNATTQNFNQGSWENPVDINISLPTVTGMTSRKDEINSSVNLGFTSGSITIPWNDTNTTKKLSFNFERTVNIPLNPFIVNGTNINLTALSRYTSSTSNTKDVTGTNTAVNNATFIYGRSHAPRQRYKNDNGIAFIYYEAYCFGTDANGVICNKSLLPNGLNSRNTNDLRWFVNSTHNVANDGSVVDTVTEKLPNNVVTEDIALRNSVNSKTEIKLNYDDTTFGYPYKTTMENNASSWLIHNEHDAGATTNQFSVEFSQYGGAWSGKHKTDTVTKDHNVTNTNRRSMW